MSINPILKREITVQSRGVGLPIMVSGLNLALFVVALTGVFGIVTRMRLTTESEYGAFLLIYALVVLLEFLLLVFVTPSLTAGSISMERSMETLDLMLTTQLTPAKILAGKLSASAWTLAILLCSCLPAMFLPLVYGGITVLEIAGLFFIFLLEAAVLLCIGLYASSLTANTAKATAAAYGIVGALCIALPALCLLLSPFFGNGKNYFAYVLLLNPLCTAACAVAGQTGQEALFLELFERLSLVPDNAFIRYFVPISLLAQLTLAFFLLLFAVTNITPKRGKERAFRRRGKRTAVRETEVP